MTAQALKFELVRAPWGEVRVVTGDRGVLSVELRPRSVALLRERLESALGVRVELAQARGLTAAREVAEYLQGKRRSFAVPLDFALVSGFQERVLRTLVRITFGDVVSYGALAGLAGSPGGARAVGGAMRRNPLPLIVPCHRVVAADGTLGGFTGGLDIKRQLLRLEGRSV